jgi:hypothetical protein
MPAPSIARMNAMIDMITKELTKLFEHQDGSYTVIVATNSLPFLTCELRIEFQSRKTSKGQQGSCIVNVIVPRI